ncbi:MAG TPA: hypothetical protein VGH39_15350 [Xanthobacteraceae bacterium]
MSRNSSLAFIEPSPLLHEPLAIFPDLRPRDGLSIAAVSHYLKQINEYRRHTGAKRALLVLMTPGKILEAP